MNGETLLRRRSSGMLLHLTSLPGPHGCGDLGPEAERCIEFLAAAGQRWWQMLPIHPPGKGNSPYMATSAFAGSPLLISLHKLRQEGLLSRGDVAPMAGSDPRRVDYPRTAEFRERRLRLAYGRLERPGLGRLRARFEAFRERPAPGQGREVWLEDYALFCALLARNKGRPWPLWEPALRRRQPAALALAKAALAEEVRYHEFLQFLFARQWDDLRSRARERGVALLGDVPIFVALHSADVWARQDLFRLDRAGRPTVVAGVPPDAFSREGQRWGNPLYRWDRLRHRGYGWWVQRIAAACRRFDAVRLDHFIGFQRYWEIPADEPSARKGHYRPGPRDGLFHVLRAALGGLPLVAEDLGVLTPEVVALRERFDLPGLRVLQFALDGDPDRNPNLPYHYPRRCVVYTGTHDNDTALGWYRQLAAGGRRGPGSLPLRRLRAMLGAPGDVSWGMVRMALLSVADLAIIPAQDLLGLGSEARMNRPGIGRGNWEWRLKPGALTPALAERLALLTAASGRLG